MWKECSSDDHHDDGSCPSYYFRGRFSRSLTPAILYVCQESRHVGEMHYRRSSLCHGIRTPSGLPCDFIWLNFDIDTVQLPISFLLISHPRLLDRRLIQRLRVICDEADADWLSGFHTRLGNFGVLKSVDFIEYDRDLSAWYTVIADPETDWGCDPTIIRVINNHTGEVLGYDRDKELVDFDAGSLDCSGTCVHLGTHEWDWAIDDGTWYTRVFGDV